MSISVPNDPQQNSETAAKMLALRERASQQPISYKWLFDQSMELADDLMHRAVCAEAEIGRLRQRVAVLEMVISEELDPYDCCDDANEMIVQQIRDRKDASSPLTSNTLGGAE